MMLSLVARDRHPGGLNVMTTMQRSNAYAMSDDWIRYVGKPSRQPVDSELLGMGPCYRLYRTADGWVFLAVTNDVEWDRLANVVGLAGDARFGNERVRRSHADELAEVLQRVFLDQSADEWESQLLSAGVGCVRADRGDYGDFLQQQQGWLRESGFVVDTDHPTLGSLWRQGATLEMADSPMRTGAAAEIGQQSTAILEELGFSASEIAGLRERAVVV